MLRFIIRGALVMVAVFLLTNGSMAAGRPMDFNLPSMDGGYLKLSDFRGRVVVLDFFATWCRPCKESMPHLDALHNKYHSKGLSVIGFDVDEPLSKVKPFILKMGLNFPVVLGSLAEARRFAPVKGLPSTVIIDPKGRVVRHFVGKTPPPALLAAVSPYLSSKAPPAPTFAKFKRRKKNDKRFGRIWVMTNEKVGNLAGVSFYVEADVTDLSVERGLWLELNLQAEKRNISGSLFPISKPKQLYKRINDSLKTGFKLFIPCDQFPELAERGVYRSWFTLVNAKRERVEKSGEMIVTHLPCPPARTW
jgi:thiol-disulfide isomerase/thioredoxin